MPALEPLVGMWSCGFLRAALVGFGFVVIPLVALAAYVNVNRLIGTAISRGQLRRVLRFAVTAFVPMTTVHKLSTFGHGLAIASTAAPSIRFVLPVAGRTRRLVGQHFSCCR
jgi:hypothetical protein